MSNRFQNRYAAGGLFAIIGVIFFLFALAAQWQGAASADRLTDIRMHGVDVSVQVTQIYHHPGSQTEPMTVDIKAVDTPAPADLPAAISVGPVYGRYLLQQGLGSYLGGDLPVIKLRHLTGSKDYLAVDDTDAWKAPKEDTTGLMVIGGLMLAAGVLVFIFYDRIVRKPA